MRRYPEGASLEQIEQALVVSMPRRTLQHRVRLVVDKGRLGVTGERRWARYRIKTSDEQQVIAGEARIEEQGSLFVPVSKKGAAILAYVRKPEAARKPAGYDRKFLDAYRPDATAYLSAKEREHLHKIGTPQLGEQPAGAYAKQIFNRLLIDLSWNSGRLEGNTYSLLDTKRLIDLDQQAERKDQLETQMIPNHTDAIEFLVREADEIGLDRDTILNLHGMLTRRGGCGALQSASLARCFIRSKFRRRSRNASTRSSPLPLRSGTPSSRDSLSWCRFRICRPSMM